MLHQHLTLKLGHYSLGKRQQDMVSRKTQGSIPECDQMKVIIMSSSRRPLPSRHHGVQGIPTSFSTAV